eukprot:m.118632 g.118632  ORF g.118632 m.118632 type:complete len:249 (+) comp52017_c0_seq8:2572-3318(+)
MKSGFFPRVLFHNPRHFSVWQSCPVSRRRTLAAMLNCFLTLKTSCCLSSTKRSCRHLFNPKSAYNPILLVTSPSFRLCIVELLFPQFQQQVPSGQEMRPVSQHDLIWWHVRDGQERRNVPNFTTALEVILHCTKYKNEENRKVHVGLVLLACMRVDHPNLLNRTFYRQVTDSVLGAVLVHVLENSAYSGIADLIDFDIASHLVGFNSTEDNQGFAHPDTVLGAKEVQAFTRELQDVFGRAREHVDSAQ